MKIIRRLLSLFLFGLSFGFIHPLRAANWSNWRGPDGNGSSAEKNLPLKWSDRENVRWRVDLPDAGNSSPIVWGNRVFVAQAIQTENRRTLICFDSGSGKLVWQSGITYAEPEHTQEDNPYCAGTPATDGERIYVSLGSPGVYAYDFSGKEVWRRDLGKLDHMFGTAVSPLIYGELCILNYGPGKKARLIALNRKTGQTVWEAQPPQVEPSEQQQGIPGGGGRGRPGGGPGGFGPADMLASLMLDQADKNGDQQLSKEEFSDLADAWFDKLDPQKEGKLSQKQFTANFGEVLPTPADGGGSAGGRGGGPARFIAPALFNAADTDKDGSLARAEWKATFDKWAMTWDSDKSGSLNEEKLRAGLTAALPSPNFGGPGGPGGRGPGGGDPGGSWSTPIVVKVDGHDELVVGFPFRLVGLEPKTGKQLWFSKGLGGSIYTTPLWSGDKLVASSGGPGGGSAIAIKPGGAGDVTESQRVWGMARAKSAYGSGVIYEGHLFTISQEGIAECSDLATGKPVWQERLNGPGAQTGSWSSMLLANGRIYVPNKSGDVFVLRASPRFEPLATNSVGEPTNASLAAADNAIFLRTDKALWCLTDGK